MRTTVSKLSIGLVTSPSEESKQLISLLGALGVQVTFHITPQEISRSHIEDESLNVWLLNVDDDHWDDKIDQLLDESEASIYFNEPGTLSKQSHPDFWCQKLVSRLYELTGLTEETTSEPKISEAEVKTTEVKTTEVNTTEVNTTEVNKTETKKVEPSTEKKNSAASQPQKKIETKVSTQNESKNVKPETKVPLGSVDELSSALDQLETSSIGLPSDIAADLVLELESISPDLDNAIEDSVSLESELSFGREIESLESFDDDLDFSLENEDDELSILDEKIEIEDESLEDFSEINIDVPAPDFSIDQNESAGIADEIMALAAEPEDSFEDIQSVEISLDEIDFSNSSIPVLESAREDDQKTLESHYAEKDEEEQSPEDEIFLQDSDELETVEIEIAELPQEPVESALELESELSFDIDEPNQEITGKANFITEEITEQVEDSAGEDAFQLDEGFELDDLALTSIEEEKIEGKAVFLEDDELKPIEPSVSIEKEPELEQDGLSLQSIETQPITGRAVFIEEEPVEKPESNLEEAELLDDGGLSLESDFEGLTTGKAEFVIDDQPNESELAKKPLVAEKKVAVNEIPEEDPSGLNLQPMDEKNQTNWLDKDTPDAEDTAAELVEPELLEPEFPATELSHSEQEMDQQIAAQDEDFSSIDELDFEVDLDDDLIKPSSITEMDDVTELSVPQAFEIPMLEESATGLDFEEVVQQPSASELTPCWVIGASLGGPAAVKRFLQSLPADINASFIVTQHIDENFLPVLAEILTSNSHFQVQVAKGSNSISAGRIYLAPLKGKLIFLKDGSMLVDHSQKWSEPYLPCIDDVIESLAVIYGEKSGAIIFSGMGQDGLNGAKKMLSLNGQIWAQSTDTCANSSMPEAIINAGLASVVAAPEMLADRLVSYLNQ